MLGPSSQARARRCATPAWRLTPTWRRKPTWRRTPAWGLALIVCTWFAGCAYFNTFYNANQFFKEAERLRKGPGGADAASATYGRAIDKCLDLIRNHPNSGHVDDALFMIGLSHMYRGENVQAQDSFRDMLDRFPETEFRERAWFYMGIAALDMGDIAAATGAFNALREEYPSSEYNVEAVYRTAESQLDERDYSTARDALHAFILEYPDSPFAVEAQVQVARTFFEEARYLEARQEFQNALKGSMDDDLRYEARLHVALTKRNEAEQILADPALYTQDDLPEGLRVEQPRVGVADSARVVGDSLDVVVVPVADLANSIEALPDSLRELREYANDLLRQAANELDGLRKPARKLGLELEVRIELALTTAFLGDADQAIDDLDQIARTDVRGQTGARAQFAIGEIQRRRGRLQEALEAYEAAQRVGRNSDLGQQAVQKSVAIRARSAALERLSDAAEVRRRWRVAQGLEAPGRDDGDLLGPDSTDVRLDIELRYAESAGHLLRVAEIDLLELEQPRLALREFQRLLRDYPGSAASARAAYAIGWIYDTVLLDVPRALAAYDVVMRDYPYSPQARQARESAASLRALRYPNVEGAPSSQP